AAAAHEADGIDLEHKSRLATLGRCFREEDESAAEGKLGLVQPLGMLHQQKAEIGRRLRGRGDRQEHGGSGSRTRPCASIGPEGEAGQARTWPRPETSWKRHDRSRASFSRERAKDASCVSKGRMRALIPSGPPPHPPFAHAKGTFSREREKEC